MDFPVVYLTNYLTNQQVINIIIPYGIFYKLLPHRFLQNFPKVRIAQMNRDHLAITMITAYNDMKT